MNETKIKARIILMIHRGLCQLVDSCLNIEKKRAYSHATPERENKTNNNNSLNRKTATKKIIFHPSLGGYCSYTWEDMASRIKSVWLDLISAMVELAEQLNSNIKPRVIVWNVAKTTLDLVNGQR